jgi:hypothetical protein
MCVQVFEQKEKAIAEMGVLMAQAEKEQAGFEEEWRQLTQIIEDNKRERVSDMCTPVISIFVVTEQAAGMRIQGPKHAHTCLHEWSSASFQCSSMTCTRSWGISCYLQERLRAQELALRERETQELLKSGILGSTGGWAKAQGWGHPGARQAEGHLASMKWCMSCQAWLACHAWNLPASGYAVHHLAALQRLRR